MIQKLNILITTYPEAFLHKGGSEQEIYLVSKTLDTLGIRNSIYGYQSSNLEDYTHIFHFSMIPNGLGLARYIKNQSNAKLILWPQFWNVEQNPETSKEIANLFDLIVFKSTVEREIFHSKYLDIEDINTIVLNPFCDDFYFQDHTYLSGSFKEIFNLNKYFLWTGILDPSKGQLDLIKAIHGLDIKIVFIGNYRNRQYFDECTEKGARNCIFLGELPPTSDLLVAAYLDCEKYIELCPDPAGISSIEACALNCNLILANNRWSNEIFGDAITTVDLPFDINDLKKAFFSSPKLSANSTNSIHAATQEIAKLIDEVLKLR